MDEFQPKDATTPETAYVARFALDEVSAVSYVRFLAKHPRNKQICICGHNINSHDYSPTLGYSCRSGNIWCECAAPVAVYSASDARLFKRSTHGFGKKHALGLGIASLLERNGHGEWLIVPKCEVGGCLNTELTIACLDRNNQVVEKSTPNSLLLCNEHAYEFGSWKLSQ